MRKRRKRHTPRQSKQNGGRMERNGNKPPTENEILDAVLSQDKPVTANTESIFEKARNLPPDAFADLFNTRVNKHLGFSIGPARRVQKQKRA